MFAATLLLLLHRIRYGPLLSFGGKPTRTLSSYPPSYASPPPPPTQHLPPLWSPPPPPERQRRPPQPPPPPTSLGRAIAARVAVSAAMEAAEDMKLEFNNTCNPTSHAGFGGAAFTWGMTFKTESAVACCSACQAHQRICGSAAEGEVFFVRSWRGERSPARCAAIPGRAYDGKGCNTWVFCPEPRCWTKDPFNHTFGECWLKFSGDPSWPKSPNYGPYPESFRSRHRTAPAMVQWMSGALTGGKPLVVDGPHWPL